MFPFPKSPSSRTPDLPRSPGISSEERGRFVILGALFLACVAGIVGLYAFHSTRKQEAPKPAVATPTPVPGVLPPVEITAVPLFPEEQAAEIEKSFADEKNGFDAVRDGVSAPEPVPYDFLIEKATLDARVLNLLPEGYDAEPPIEKILADPGAYRGRFFRVTGELLALAKAPYGGGCKHLQDLRTGVVRDGKGRLFSFSWPLVNALEPDPVAPGAGWVRLHGMFYKTWPVADASKGGAETPSLHLVLSRRPTVDFPAVQLREIDPSWMAEVRDAKPEEMLSFDEDSFFRLMNVVKTLGPAGFEASLQQKQAETPGAKLWPPEDMTSRYKELLAAPDAWRFRPIQVTGLLAKPTPVKATRANPGNVENLWIGVLVGTDFAPAFWVCSPRPFSEMGLKAEDMVRVEGIFYKRKAYEPGNGKGLLQCAIVVAGRMQKVQVASRRVEKDVLLGIIGLMVVLVGSLAFVLLQGRRDARAAEARRLERLAKHRVVPERRATDSGGVPQPPREPPAPGPGTGA